MVSSLQKFRNKYFGAGTTLGKISRGRTVQTLKAAVTGKGVTANVKNKTVKKVLETAASHPFATAGLVAGGVVAGKAAAPLLGRIAPKAGAALSKAAPKVGKGLLKTGKKGASTLLKNKKVTGFLGTTATFGLISPGLVTKENVGRLAGYTINPKAAVIGEMYNLGKYISGTLGGAQGKSIYIPKKKDLALAGAGAVGAGAGAYVLNKVLGKEDTKGKTPSISTPSKTGVKTQDFSLPESPSLVSAPTATEIAQPPPFGAVEPVVSPTSTVKYRKATKRRKKKKKARLPCRIRRRRQPNYNKASNVNKIYIQNKAG